MGWGKLFLLVRLLASFVRLLFALVPFSSKLPIGSSPSKLFVLPSKRGDQKERKKEERSRKGLKRGECNYQNFQAQTERKKEEKSRKRSKRMGFDSRKRLKMRH